MNNEKKRYRKNFILYIFFWFIEIIMYINETKNMDDIAEIGITIPFTPNKIL